MYYHSTQAMQKLKTGRNVPPLNPTDHPPVRLRVIAHLKYVLAGSDEVPFAIEGLRTEIPLPNTKVHRFEPSVSGFGQA
jgi:hypothetical protein